MEIVIDKRIELMTVVQTLCNYWDNLALRFSQKPLYHCKYKNDVKEVFEKYKNHEIIELYSILSNDIMDISTFINIALCYSDPPELKNIADYESNFGTIYNCKFPYIEFISKLRNFYYDSEFEQFYNKCQNDYMKILSNYGNKKELSEDTILNYLGSKAENYCIIISPLVMGNFGIKINTNAYQTLHYSVISPYDYKENEYIFGSINFRKELLWHEISHLTINGLTKKFINQFNINEKHVPEIFVKHLYTNIEVIVNEYIIRAITIRLLEMNGEIEFMNHSIENHISKGFQNIVEVKEYIIRNHEENKKIVIDNRYKNLVEYIIEKI